LSAQHSGESGYAVFFSPRACRCCPCAVVRSDRPAAVAPTARKPALRPAEAPSDPGLEASSTRAIDDIRQGLARLAALLDARGFPGLTSTYLLASVAEIRVAIVPPRLTCLDRRG